MAKDDPRWLSLGGDHSLSGWRRPPHGTSSRSAAATTSAGGPALAALRAVDPGMAVNIEHEDQGLHQLEGLGYAADTLLREAGRPIFLAVTA